MQQDIPGNSNQVDEKSPVTPDLHEEIASIRESLNQTRTEMSLYRRRMEKRQSEVDAHIHRTNVLWIVMFLGIAGLGSAIFYGFHSRTLIVRSAAAQATSSVAQSGVSSSEEQLKPILGPAPSPEPETAQPKNAKENIPSVQPQRESTSTLNAASNPERGPVSSSSDTRLLADTVNRTRIDFEVLRNKTQEVAPGIFLTVRDMNVERQLINGWLQISEDGRTVWLRDQGAQKVMIFSTKRDERSHELIFTRVSKQGVAGYLLIPTTAG